MKVSHGRHQYRENVNPLHAQDKDAVLSLKTCTRDILNFPKLNRHAEAEADG